MICGVCGKETNRGEMIQQTITCGADDCVEAIESPDLFRQKKLRKHVEMLEDALRTASAKLKEQAQFIADYVCTPCFKGEHDNCIDPCDCIKCLRSHAAACEANELSARDQLNYMVQRNKKLRELVTALHEVTATYGAFGPTEKQGEWLQKLIDDALK